MGANNIAESQCWKIQNLLKKGESWTRQAWIDHPLFAGRRPRIIVLRNYDAPAGYNQYQDQFKQIWNGDSDQGEPQLCMTRYRPCNEDWAATDWLRVDGAGVPVDAMGSA